MSGMLIIVLIYHCHKLLYLMDLRAIDCEDGSWMEVARDRVPWQVSILAVLNLHVLLPQC
jgi:hypothetical protein